MNADHLCPKCGRVLVTKRKPGRRPFLACPGYPTCQHTEAMSHPAMLRLMGQPELPLEWEETAAASAAVDDRLSQQ